MRNLAQGLLRTLCVLIDRHAKDEELLAYKDGEVGRASRWRLKIHLTRCQSCRGKFVMMEEDLKAIKRIDDGLYAGNFLNLRTGVEKLRQAMQGWEARNSLECEGYMADNAQRNSILRRVATEFDLYLGNRATATIILKLKGRKNDQQNPLIEAESVLRDFLGPGAASAVTQRIVNLQMSGDRGVRCSPTA